MERRGRRVASGPVVLLLAFALAGCGSTPSPSPSADVAVASPTPATSASPTPSPSPTATAAPTPLLEPADLDGVLVDPALAHRLPLAVSIDDARAARPQSGFNASAIVWQAPADGYEVRYLLVLQEGEAADVGPVRSTRTYLAQWAAEDRAALAHYGGDKAGLAWVRANRGKILTDVDGLGAGSSAYHRISTRTAPHNAFTSTDALRAVAAKLGGSPDVDPAVHLRPFRDDSPAALRGSVQHVVVPYRTVTVGYDYDPATNAYLRTLNGAPHVDPVDGRQVTARTVIVLFQTFRTDTTIEPGHARPVLGSIGQGSAIVFMEGLRIEARWSKADDHSPTLILASDGTELPLVRGRIFIQVVPIGTKVTG
jgi:hypothetical protein